MATLTEAQAITHHSFFSGKIKDVAAGQPFTDDVMKELMIESSARLSDWLVLKEVMGESEVYALTIAAYLAEKASELPELPTFLPLSPDEEKGLRYLRSMEIPMVIKPTALKLKKALTDTSEFFWRGLISNLKTAMYVDEFHKNARRVSWRRQANVITHHVYRLSELEDIHAGAVRSIPESILNLEIKTTLRMRDWLTVIEVLYNTDAFNTLITSYWASQCKRWEE